MPTIVNLALLGATFAALLWGSPALLFLFVLVLILTQLLSAFAVHKGASRIVWFWPVVAIAAGFVGANLTAARVEDPLWGHFVHDAALGWKPKPNLRDEALPAVGSSLYRVTTDTHGYRNSGNATEFDFILQGDSNGFGFGVGNDQHLCALIDRCYNASVPGYDLNQFILQARGGFPVKARTRILLFNLENDFTLTVFATPYLVRRPHFDVDGGKLHLISRSMPLLKQIYGFRFIDRYANYNVQLAPFEQGQSWGNHVPDWIIRFPALQRAALRNEKTFQALSNIGSSVPPPDLYQWPDQPDWLLTKKETWPEPYRSYAADFEMLFGQYLREAGDAIVILRPMKKQVVRSEREAAIARLASKQIDILALNRFVGDIARKHGARVIDPTEAFQNQPDPDSLFLPGDTHLSAAGHALIAAELKLP